MPFQKVKFLNFWSIPKPKAIWQSRYLSALRVQNAYNHKAFAIIRLFAKRYVSSFSLHAGQFDLQAFLVQQLCLVSWGATILLRHITGKDWPHTKTVTPYYQIQSMSITTLIHKWLRDSTVNKEIVLCQKFSTILGGHEVYEISVQIYYIHVTCWQPWQPVIKHTSKNTHHSQLHPRKPNEITTG